MTEVTFFAYFAIILSRIVLLLLGFLIIILIIAFLTKTIRKHGFYPFFKRALVYIFSFVLMFFPFFCFPEYFNEHLFLGAFLSWFAPLIVYPLAIMFNNKIFPYKK